MTIYIDNDTQEPFDPKFEEAQKHRQRQEKMWERHGRVREDIRQRHTRPGRDMGHVMEMSDKRAREREQAPDYSKWEDVDYGLMYD